MEIAEEKELAGFGKREETVVSDLSGSESSLLHFLFVCTENLE